MVSSTFYDLQQVRNDLRVFLEDELGYAPLLSEFSSFPVDPDLDTVENCRRRVEENADILVLVVGGRYGSLDPRTEKSITNLEYIEARKKGIPVYAFVKRAVLEVLPVWKTNAEADFSAVVDTSELFVFLDELRDEQRVWTFPFETAQDITAGLRRQFAHLMTEALRVRRRLLGGGIPDYLQDASPALLRVALHRPDGWEYTLFARCWCDQVNALSGLLREHQAGIRSGTAESVETHEVRGWMKARLDELSGLADDSSNLINTELQEALGAPGEPCDPEYLIWVAKQLGARLRQALIWVSSVRCASIPSEAEELRQELVGFATQIIAELEQFPRQALIDIEDALAAADRGEGPQAVKLTLTFDSPDMSGFEQALSRFVRGSGLS